MAQTHPTVYALDNYYAAISLLICVGYQLIGLTIAYSFKFDKINDLWGGSNFAILAIITLAFSGTTVARNIVVSIFLILWATRLSGFLFFRILKTGSDDRFDDKRDNLKSIGGFYVFQTIWCWVVSFPVTFLNSPAVLAYPQPSFGYATDIIAVIIFALAFSIEAISDVQKYLFKQKNEKSAVCDTGLWKFSRHPNYFGEIMVQVSIFIMAITPAAYGYIPQGTGAYAALYSSMLGFFLLTTLLLFVSGLNLQERPGAKKRYEKGDNWPAYEKYLHDTSILIPMPPAIWKRLPVFVKRTIGCEWPMYAFDPAKHADQKKVQERESEEGRSGSQEGLNNQSS